LAGRHTLRAPIDERKGAACAATILVADDHAIDKEFANWLKKGIDKGQNIRYYMST